MHPWELLRPLHLSELTMEDYLRDLQSTGVNIDSFVDDERNYLGRQRTSFRGADNK